MEDAWFSSTKPLKVSAPVDGGQEAKAIWFKSPPLTLEFCDRVMQLQLCTNSHDQGQVDSRSLGSWTWFNIAILSNEDDSEPRLSKEGKPLVWRSHHNQLGQETSTFHFGVIFDRRSELLANLEVCIVRI
jgi:hypothetical protein